MEESLTLEKRQLLRNNEYYEMQYVFDKLYWEANSNNKFVNLMDHISNERNILLAYRNIKKNKGSTTVGNDNRDISYFRNMETTKFVEYMQNKFRNYKPKSVRRVEIPKHNGKLRPLGIPCMDDRIIQQCIKQVLEPICEAKFHKHSYGFRPNRNTSHAIARCMSLMNKSKLHYVVDIDIKGFFDNVNHGKLKRQLWSLGIQDKNLLCIIGKILNSEIQGIGVPTKGTPQGGIISPLLANVVLNELDWWISSQWETFETKRKYPHLYKYKAQKATKLKEVWLVRYADDFKIFCRDYKTAQKIYNSTRLWLKERLDLEISPDKSKITNLRKNYTEFLGFNLKVKPKGKKYVSKDFKEIDFLVRKTLKTRLKRIITNKPNLSETYRRLFGKYKGKTITICNTTVFPIYGCTTKAPMCFSQQVCNYTVEGRQLIHTKLKGYGIIIEHLLNNFYNNNTTEFNDNRISLMAGQRGVCYVTGELLQIGDMECHHKTPRHLGGSDEYRNLVWITSNAHKLIHSTNLDTVKKYLSLVPLDKEGLKKVNSLRKLVGNSVI